MCGRDIDASLEEILNDIDEFIESEMGHAPLNITESFTFPEIHNLSSMFETEGTPSDLLWDNMLDPSHKCTTQRLFGRFTWSDNNNKVTDLSGGINFLPRRGLNQEIHNLSSMLETEGTPSDLLWDNILGNEAASSIDGQDSSNKVSEVEVQVQVIGLKDVYNKKTKKTNKGLEYCLEDSEVTLVAQASDKITSIRAYTQRCVEAAIRTHDTVGPVELNVNILQSEATCRVVIVDLGSVFKTRGDDEVYRLEKADVMERNKWEMLIAMEFSSGLKGTVKSEAFRVTTKAKYKVKRNVEDPSHKCTTQRLFGRFTWSDNNNKVTDLSGGINFLPRRGLNQEFPHDETCALNCESFNLLEEDHREARYQFVDDSRTDLRSRSGSLGEEKILLQRHTVLDRQMVTMYYRHNPKIHYVIEQSDLPGMLKLVGKRSSQVSAGHKADCRKNTRQFFLWACGRCFFERQKKSSIKAHITQRVCQKPINVKAARRKSTSPHLSSSELEEDTFEGYCWESPLSVK